MEWIMRSRRGRRPTALRRSLLPYLFSAAAMVYLIVFLAWPVVHSVRLSTTDARLVAPGAGESVGLANYRDILGDGRFLETLTTTFVYAAATVAGSIVVGVFGAVLLNRSFRGRAAARAVLIFPWAAPTVAAALIFTWMFNQSSGVLNYFTGLLGLEPTGWTNDPDWALYSVIAASVWKVFPFVMLVVLAAMQSIPDEHYEAARLDGADALSTFKGIVLPQIMPTVRVVALLMTIWSFRRFEMIWLLTKGGPLRKTNTIVVDVFREGFLNSELGSASALGTIGLGLSLFVTVVFFVVERRVELADSPSAP